MLSSIYKSIQYECREFKNKKAFKITLKNSWVVPLPTQPYWIAACLAKSSADSMLDVICLAVKNAVKLAV